MNHKKVKDKTYGSLNRFGNKKVVHELFKKSKEKLFQVNLWSKLPGITASFQLYGSRGIEKFTDSPCVNDYIKIVLPGPFPENWVVVTNVVDEKEMASFTVSPSQSPADKWYSNEEVQHFFIDEATSTFKVHIEGTEIHALEIGKNEAINNKGEEAGNRKLINTLLAEFGWAGFQEYQWQKLLDYLVHKVEIE
ncbi:hypothetical protein [Flagellimonas abyssi]|jgi:hypothetical protein|uniref:DUF402 domain-containing protein n=1 Tax=Flagellimonas abyssi TaxID=2864871 RepID=A0ABS7EU41_9FLAO|nr:hypothetical protein [Allomuricauda abyssi]MBW8201133.1 hypothetical protein [Allomuricauda abyssi]